MEVYTLDGLYRREHVIDKYISLIWTERFKRVGDFELIVHSTKEHRDRLRVDTYLSINESIRLMKVETVEDATDGEGRATLKVKGRSLEYIMANRLARGTLSDLVTEPKWILTGLPAAIARQMFHDICVTGILDAGDVLPNINEGSAFFPTDTIAEPTDSITYSVDPKDLYTALYELCDLYEMGFRLFKDPDTLNFWFDIYMGSDRTTKQTGLPAVVFSPDLDNLTNTTDLTTTALYKNCAYVISKVGHELVYPLDVDPSVDGFQRHVLFVKADDIEDAVPADATAKMIQRGKEELSKYRRLQAFDGELNSNVAYKYGNHYYLGDLVEFQSGTGAASVMQVTEQIFVSDEQGDRSYPTLSINTFITPGSWLSWDFGQVWEDVDPDLDWADASP